MSVERDYYALLGVSSTASFEEIRYAYRKCAFVAHPDHGGSTSKMLTLNEAWEVLRDVQRRAEYDAQRRATTQNGGKAGAKPARPRRVVRRPAKSKLPSFAQMAGSFVGSAFRAITGTGKPAALPKPARPRPARIVKCRHCGQKLRVKPTSAATAVVCPKCRQKQDVR